MRRSGVLSDGAAPRPFVAARANGKLSTRATKRLRNELVDLKVCLSPNSKASASRPKMSLKNGLREAWATRHSELIRSSRGTSANSGGMDFTKMATSVRSSSSEVFGIT